MQARQAIAARRIWKLKIALLAALLIAAIGAVVTASLQVRVARADPSAEDATLNEAYGILDPTTIPKYVDPLVIPPVMPPKGIGGKKAKNGAPTVYEISVKQFNQQILPSTGYGRNADKPYPMTTVWGYGRKGDPLPGSGKKSTYNYPALTVESRTFERVRVLWTNELMTARRTYLPHLLPLDQTLHWANPPMPDMNGDSPLPYTGPVPIVVHVHGAHVPPVSDGHPEAWYLPNARNIPASYAKEGTNYGSVIPAPPGAAWFEYPNDQRATTLWYHDHALGMTRLNVYAGLAGFWLLRDQEEDSLNLPGPAPKLGDRPGTKYYEIPMAIQDRSFKTNGSLFYPNNRAYFEELPPDEFNIPTIPQEVDGTTSDVSPIWNPEFFGNTMVVNGKTWPYLEVEPRRYRFRLLNGCDSRTLILKLSNDLPFYQIGSEGGLLPNSPVMLSELLVGPAERPDVIVDFSSMAPGDEVILLNLGPDEPFQGVGDGEEPSDPDTTGQVMQFRVVPLSAPDTSVDPANLVLPAIEPLGVPAETRSLTLNEKVSEVVNVDSGPLQPGDEPFGPVGAFLGTAADGALAWSAPITEKPRIGDTEMWQIANLTVDSHPIHLHMVQFQVVDRIPFDAEAYMAAQQEYLSTPPEDRTDPPPDPLDPEFWPGGVQPDPIPPEPWETGWKDTVMANPAEVTRIKAQFDLVGLYVWHCHILSHEDNEMMRPYEVVDGD